MKTLLQTHSVGYAESIRLALELEDIEAVLLDQFQPGFLHFAGRVRVVVINDGDFPRAQALLRGLELPRTGPPPSWKWQKRGLGALGLGLVFFVVGLGSVDAGAGRVLTRLLFAASALCTIVGVVLIAEGPRADKRQDQAANVADLDPEP